MSKPQIPEIGSRVETNSGISGTIVAYWEDWQAPGNIHIRLDSGHESRWAFCKVTR